MAYKYDPYQESEQVQAYKQQLEQLNNSKPAEYSSQYTQKAQDALNAYTNRDNFSYDYNNDPLYKQYQQSYMRQGKQAMQDTVGQAAAMNGGYGTSYGQTAGQQVFNNYMTGLNDKIPELYNLALSRYQQEGNDMLNKYSALSAAENQDYSRYQDNYNKWSADRDYTTNLYNNERSYDRANYDTDRTFNYNTYLQRLSDAQQEVQWYWSNGLTPPADLVAEAGYSQQTIDDLQAKWAADAAAAAAAAAQEEVYYGGGGGTSSQDKDKNKNKSSSSGSSWISNASNAISNAVSNANSAASTLGSTLSNLVKKYGSK